MKIPVFLILVLACCNAARAQDEPNAAAPAQTPRWSFDILGGPAIPVGQYAGYVYANRNIAPVKTGGLVELSGTYHVNRSFGITLVANGQINRVKSLPADVQNPTALTTTGPYVPTPYDDHWKIARLMAGGVYTLPLNKSRQFNLLARVLGGLQKTQTAGYTQGDIESTNDFTVYNTATLPWTFTYEGDIGFKWRTGGHLALIAYAGYNGSLSNYTRTYEEPVEPLPPFTTLELVDAPVKHKTNLPTASLLFRAGIAWDL